MGKRYTLYMDGDIIESSDDLGELVDVYSEIEEQCQEDILIMDNLTDDVVYG